MVIQSQEDSIVHHLSSDYIFNHLGSERKELIILDNTAHNQLLASKQRNQLFGQIVNFINSLL
jgi:esterase/lipase